MKSYLNALMGSIAVAALAGTSAIAQSPGDHAKGMAHIAAAKKAAGYETYEIFDHTCQRLLVGVNLPFGRAPAPATRDPAQFFQEPAKVFDNVYYVGEKMLWGGSPSAWAIKTSDGIILIDTMYEDSMQSVLLPGMKKMGLDPKDIKYIILTHGHGDHVGGAKYIQDTYKPHVILGGPDWDALDKPNFRGPKPTRDISATDGMKVTLGDETITIYLTPGHTPGTVSLLIPVKDNGVPHLAALWGGTGMQYDPAQYGKNAERFRQIVAKSKADVLMLTHSQLDKTDVKLPLLAKRKPGEPNPWVVGNQVLQNFLTVARECGAAAALMPEEYAGYLGRPPAAPGTAAAPAGGGR